MQKKGKCHWRKKTLIFCPVESFSPPLGGRVIHDVWVNDVLCCNLPNLTVQVPSIIGIFAEILCIKSNEHVCPRPLFSWEIWCCLQHQLTLSYRYGVLWEDDASPFRLMSTV